MSKILLINTSFPSGNIRVRDSFFPPLGLLTIATSLIESGFDVKLVDPQLDANYENSIEQIMKDRPLFVGMTTFMGTNLSNAIKLSERVKKLDSDIPIIWGGPLATSSPTLCLKNAPIDYIVMGMGEETVVRISNKLKKGEKIDDLENVSFNKNNKIVLKSNYFFSGNLDKLHYPKLDLWKEGIIKKGTIPILSSRGCPRNCSFCYNNTFTGRKKWYGRTKNNVMEEMDYWANYFNINRFYFVDDNFLVDTKRACEILESNIKRNYTITQILGHMNDFKPEILSLISNYIKHVGFSIESASPTIQQLLNKPINLDHALTMMENFTKTEIEKITTNFLFGFPTETDNDILLSIEMATKIRNLNNNIRIIPYIYTPQPKDDIVAKYNLLDSINFSLDNLSTIDLAPNRSCVLSEELRPWMNKEDIRFYLDLVLVWFYHFDYVVRRSQDIDIDSIFERNSRLARLFKNVQKPL